MTRDDPDEAASFLSGREAAALLGVKRETLYAYASRGLLRSEPGGPGRGRRYNREDLERLRARSDARSGHGPVAAGALRWGEPVLESALTAIEAAGPRYRGHASAELSASAAHVQSPEFATGEGLDQRKEAASLRLVRPTGTLRYAMAEWGRTREGNARKADIFSFSSWLAEGMVALEGVELSARVERTERPEEDRLDDPYRSVRPLLDFNILGRTRWHIVTVNVGAPPVRWGGCS